ncbi:hypothetical protein Dda_8630 [Drechslerella dactyloides]|uniref:Uncharacterized protein n=1 Tax=Drechslerella dactyloides TaxID=74499 RepID=A0AAD6NHH2_DREDA|nr:hypothetical protein Dda_8630 [Drechslerella dactyloides]
MTPPTSRPGSPEPIAAAAPSQQPDVPEAPSPPHSRSPSPGPPPYDSPRSSSGSWTFTEMPSDDEIVVEHLEDIELEPYPGPNTTAVPAAVDTPDAVHVHGYDEIQQSLHICGCAAMAVTVLFSTVGAILFQPREKRLGPHVQRFFAVAWFFLSVVAFALGAVATSFAAKLKRYRQDVRAIYWRQGRFVGLDRWYGTGSSVESVLDGVGLWVVFSVLVVLLQLYSGHRLADALMAGDDA